MPDVSILIVNWNARKFLMECLDSIRATMGKFEFEVIVVDNASSDGSAQEVERRYPEVTLVRNSENLGFARGNNIGLKLARGRYVALVNSDVVLLDGCMDRLVEFMDARPEVGLSGPRVYFPDGRLQPTCRELPSARNCVCRALALDELFPRWPLFAGTFMNYWAHDSVREVQMLSGCFWMVRREALEQVGPLDEDFFFYGEDLDWCKRFGSAGWKLVYDPEAEAIHHRGASSANAPVRFFIENEKANLRYWRKHHGRGGQAFYAVVVFVHQALRVVPRGFMYALFPSKRAQIAPRLRQSSAMLSWLVGIRQPDSA